MKKLNYFLLIAFAAIMVLNSSCEKDETLVAPDAPTITVTSNPAITDGAEFAPGTEITFTVSVATAAIDDKMYQLTVTTTPPTGGLSSHVYNTTENVTYVYNVPFGGGSAVNINFAVTAVNPGDLSLTSSVSTDVVFNVAQLWSEVKNVKLNSWTAQDAVNKSMINFTTGDTYTFQESFDGSNELKAAIDFAATIKLPYNGVAGTDVVTPYLTSTYGCSTGQYAHIMNLWGGWADNKQLTTTHTAYAKYPQLDYDGGFNPEDLLLTTATSSLAVEVGDIICFETAEIGQANPTGTVPTDGDVRPNPVLIGAIKITEVNLGTIGDGTDGYIKFDYKYKAK